MLQRRFFERVARPRGIQQIAGEHRVKLEPGQVDAVTREHDHVELQVVANLANRCILEQRTQPFEHESPIQLLRNACARQQIAAAVCSHMPERNVSRLAVAGRKSNADDVRPHRGRFPGITRNANSPTEPQIGDEGVQRRPRLQDHGIVLLDVSPPTGRSR
jgi:hypothetical protein